MNPYIVPPAALNETALYEEAEKDFSGARRRAILRWVARRFRDDPLPAFKDVRKSLRAYNRVRLPGIRVVDVSSIVGSVGREKDFDSSFMPLRASVGKRWKRIGRAYLRGENLPPVSLYKIGEAYFVEDGNHRVSVAHYHGTPALEAAVTEVRPEVPTSREERGARVLELGARAA